MSRSLCCYSRVALLAMAAYASPGYPQNAGPIYAISTFAGQPFSASFGDGGPALWAWSSPLSFAWDSAGNLYVGERGSRLVRRISAAGIISTIAGAGVPGFTGTAGGNGIYLGASLGVAADPAGNVYIADLDFNRVLKVTPAGAVSTVAGTGANGDTGDGGPATAAELLQPLSLAFDPAGDLYISEYAGRRVRKVTPDGIISTVAGTGQRGSSGDGGPATAAAISPVNIAVDHSGNLYLTDGSRVREVTPDGIIHTVAGTGTSGFSGDGGPATSAQLAGPIGVAVDRFGNLYIADTYNQRVREVAAGSGTISTVAGNGILGTRLGAGRMATASQLSYPVAVIPDDSGNLYIADDLLDIGLVRKVNAQGVISIFAGAGGAGDGGPATAAGFGRPGAVATDAAGNLYISDRLTRRIRKVDAQGIITTVAGDGNAGYLGDGGPAIEATLNAPQGIAVDSSGNLYIADSDDERVRKVTPDGTIETLAGTGTAGFSGDGGPATSAQLSGPLAVAVDAAENLYILDAGNGRVRRVSATGSIETVAGGGTPADGIGDGGPATSAAFLQPKGIALDSAGNLYIADSGHLRVREVSSTGIITTAAGGSHTYGPILDGIPAIGAYLPDPVAVAVDAAGNLFIGGSEINSVRIVRPDGTMDSLLAVADAGTNTATSLLPPVFPAGLAIDPNGNVYIAEDQVDQRIRRAAVQRSTGGAPQILSQAIANAASLTLGPISPGEIVSVFGTDLGPSAGASNAPDSSGRYSLQLDGVRVWFNGIPAPVLYAQAYQVNAVVPFSIAPNSTVTVQVTYALKSSNVVSVAVSAAAPGVFVLSPPPRGGPAAAFNQDGSVNSPANPAAAGSIVVLFATGAGLWNPPLADGTLITDITPRPVLPVSVSFAGVPGEVLYAGPAPGLISGGLQINVRVPQLSCSEWFCPNPAGVSVQIGLGPLDVRGHPQYASDGNSTVAVRY